MAKTSGVSNARWAILLLLAAACATTATGRKQLTLMPQDQLQEMGAEAFTQVKHEQRVDDNPRTHAYVRCIAQAIIQAMPEGREQDWEVVVFEDDTANAFALPGGKIGVHTGMFEIAETADQLAAVIAHEIAHVTQHHSNERVSQAFVAEGGLAVASAALGSDGPSRDLALAALGLGAQIGVLMPFSRAQESEADVVGMHYMAGAGFDPEAAVQLWVNMAKADDGAPPEFLSTHPSHGSRIDELTENLDDARVAYHEAQRAGNQPNCSISRVAIGP